MLCIHQEEEWEGVFASKRDREGYKSHQGRRDRRENMAE